MKILDRLSLQLYSGRKFPPLDGQFATLAALGFKHVEPYGGLLERAKEVHDLLRRRGLTSPTCHVGLDSLTTDLAGTVAAAKACGSRFLIIPAISPEERPSDSDGWREFGVKLSRLQGALDVQGIRLVWHNHDFEFAKTADGLFPLDLIFEGAPTLGWQADIGWIERAGQNSAEWIARYSDRIVSIHLKDIAPAGENLDEDGWADVGHGTINWARLLPVLQAANAEYYVLEHDNPNDFKRFATRSYETVAAWPASS